MTIYACHEEDAGKAHEVELSARQPVQGAVLEADGRVRDRRCEIVITKRGKPVAKLVPVEEKQPDIFGYMKGTVTILGDIVGPTGEVWDADR
jgi:prevent-host-death family protein